MPRLCARMHHSVAEAAFKVKHHLFAVMLTAAVAGVLLCSGSQMSAFIPAAGHCRPSGHHGEAAFAVLLPLQIVTKVMQHSDFVIRTKS